MAGGLRIGELAERAGVGVETVRYYERRGLLPRPARRAGAFRQYDEEAVRRLRFIKRAQWVGFTLREIGELLALRVEPGAGCEDVRRRAEDKLAEVDEKMRDLQRMRRALGGLIDQCGGSGPIDRGCPILEALEDHAEGPGDEVSPRSA
jgi:Hg(II)-responsive transcriptional regulator